jgi:hypothetical protein
LVAAGVVRGRGLEVGIWDWQVGIRRWIIGGLEGWGETCMQSDGVIVLDFDSGLLEILRA